MRTLLVHNAEAGRGKLPAGTLEAMLQDSGHELVRAMPQDEGWDGLVREAARVVVAGGDGTVAKVATRLPAGAPPLAILPLGTANNIARSLGIEGTPDAIVAGLARAAERRLDIGTCRGPFGIRRFVEGAGFGVVAEAVEKGSDDHATPEDKLRSGRKIVHDALVRNRPHAVELSLDGGSLALRCLMLEVLNTPVTDSGLRLSPTADPGDGLLDLVWLEPEAREAMLAWLDDGSDGPPPLELRRAREIVLPWPEMDLRLDDGSETRPAADATLQLALAGDAVTVLVPGPPA